jgi:predicted transcriptional regulator
MSDRSAEELPGVVSRRADLLRAVRDGTMDRRDLAATLDVSRSTINRGLRELEEADLVGRADGTIALTRYGRRTLAAYDRLAATYEQLSEAEPLLDALPDAAPAALVETGEIDLATHPTPGRPLERTRTLLAGTDRVNCVTPVVLPTVVPALARRVREGAGVEVVTTRGAVSHMQSTSPEATSLFVSADGCGLFCGEDLPEVAVFVLDDRSVCVAALDDRGSPVGVVVSEAAGAVTWASDLFSRTRRGSTAMLRGGRPAGAPRHTQ